MNQLWYFFTNGKALAFDKTWKQLTTMPISWYQLECCQHQSPKKGQRPNWYETYFLKSGKRKYMHDIIWVSGFFQFNFSAGEGGGSGKSVRTKELLSREPRNKEENLHLFVLQTVPCSLSITSWFNLTNEPQEKCRPNTYNVRSSHGQVA